MGVASASRSRDMFDEYRHFRVPVFQQGLALTDADLNDGFLSVYTLARRFAQSVVGTGSPDSGFLIAQSATSTVNNFTITGGGSGNTDPNVAGKLFVAGFLAELIANVEYANAGATPEQRLVLPRATSVVGATLTNSAAQYVNSELVGRQLVAKVQAASPETFTITANTATTITVSEPGSLGSTLAEALAADDGTFGNYRVNLSTPSGADRTDEVWIDVWLDEIDATEDSHLYHTAGTAPFESARRLQLRTEIHVIEDTATYTPPVSSPAQFTDADGREHQRYKLATLSRLDGNSGILTAMIADARTQYGRLGSTGSVTNEFVTVGDGVDSFGDYNGSTQASILAAIASLPSNGGTVYLLNGTWDITSQVAITASNVSIIGTGSGTILETNHTCPNGAFAVSGSDCSIQSVRHRWGSSHTMTSGDTHVKVTGGFFLMRDVTMEFEVGGGVAHQGVYVENIGGARFESCEFGEAGDDDHTAIFSSTNAVVDGLSVVNCVFVGGQEQIDVFGGVRDLLISGCQFRDVPGAGTNTYRAVQLRGTGSGGIDVIDPVVTGCTFEDVDYYSLYLDDCHNVVVTGCAFSDGGQTLSHVQHIHVVNVSGLTVSGCSFDTTTNDTAADEAYINVIDLEFFTIVGNNFRRSTSGTQVGEGVNLNNSGTVDRGIISGNMFSGWGTLLGNTNAIDNTSATNLVTTGNNQA